MRPLEWNWAQVSPLISEVVQLHFEDISRLALRLREQVLQRISAPLASKVRRNGRVLAWGAGGGRKEPEMKSEKEVKVKR